MRTAFKLVEANVLIASYKKEIAINDGFCNSYVGRLYVDTITSAVRPKFSRWDFRR